MSPAPRSLPLETLLADAGWVRRLAARLVADPGTADDLAQQTLVAAWRHPPAPGTPARPWLARVLRNFARQAGRSESARAARERSLALGPTAPDDLLERAELAQRLARHVLELDEPYRTTVLRRFFDGWSAEQIARAQGTKPSTVRTRLERGLAKLRERLERERGSQWMAALMPLVPLKTGAVGLTGVAGGIAVGTGTKIAIGLCAAGICGWLIWPRSAPLARPLEPLASETAPAPERVEAPAQAEPRRELAASAPRPGPQAVHVFPYLIAPGTIEGIVLRRHGTNELPLEGAEVELWPTQEDEYRPTAGAGSPQDRTRSLSDGSFRFSKVAAGKFVVNARLERGPVHSARATVEEERSAPVVQIVFGSTRLHGHVYDERGDPLARVPIRVEGDTLHSGTAFCATSSAADGSWSLPELPAGVLFGWIGDDFRGSWPGRMLKLTLVDGDDFEVDSGERRAPGRWRGNVRASSGELVKSGGTLHLEHWIRSPLQSEARVYREVPFDASARFDVALEQGEWQPAVSLSSRSSTRQTFSAFPMPKQDLERDLVLSGTRVRGTVIDSVTLKPLEGYAGTLGVSVHKLGENFPAALRTVEIDAQAQFAIDMLGEGNWELSTYPLKVAATGYRLEFKIVTGEAEKVLDVQVQRP